MSNQDNIVGDGKEKRFPTWVKILLALTGLMIICCCGFFAILVYQASTPEGRATATARAAEREATQVKQTAIVAFEATEDARPTDTPIPTNTSVPTDTPTPTNTPVSTNIPIPTITLGPTNISKTTDILNSTNTPEVTFPISTPPTIIPYESGGLGLSKTQWEQNHTRTQLDWGIGTGYNNTYDVLFQQDKVWIIQMIWDRVPITADDVELISAQLIPADSEYIKTYTPEEMPVTTVIVYKSNSLATRFDATFWHYAEPGTFTVQYNTYEGFGIGDMIIGLDDNP